VKILDKIKRCVVVRMMGKEEGGRKEVVKW